MGSDVDGSNFHHCIEKTTCQASGFVDKAVGKCVAAGQCQTPDTYTDSTDEASKRMCVKASECREGYVGSDVAGASPGECVSEEVCKAVGIVDAVAHKCVDVQNCADGRYGNQETRECVDVNLIRNGCGSGHVGNDALTDTAFDGVHYYGGECIPESVCKEAGFVDTTSHKCVAECPGDAPRSLDDPRTCTALLACVSVKHAAVSEGSCACARAYSYRGGKCAVALKAVAVVAVPAVALIAAAIIVAVCVVRRSGHKSQKSRKNNKNNKSVALNSPADDGALI